MRFLTITTTLLAPLSAQAFVAFTNNAYNGITAGTPFTLTWSGDNSPVTISLLNGPKQMLLKVNTVANAISGSSFTWTPPTTLNPDVYALSITQSGITNYSPQFFLRSDGVPAPTSQATTALATTHVTSLAMTYVASSAASPASIPAATSAPAGKPPGAPSLAVVMDSKPAYSVPGNSTSTVMSSGMASGTVSGMPSGTGSAPIQKLTGGAERVERIGWVYSIAAVVVGAVGIRFAF
ncbi:hypothetical protein N7G274_006913 [Stereocaulon virgatum]|uniref:Yeast cell wall synthesis Kre9/Knh1-like N-terminal domain-containing protein n=1 Tax=Stereocaulon virgatum TaxID=373712 RepID=A0ABR4A5X4_9LECA